MWNHSISMHTGRYRHQSFWYWRLLSLSAQVSGYLNYELHMKGTVLCFWSSLRCIKIWIVNYYRGLKFPHRVVVLLALDSHAACTKVQCCFKYHPTKPQVIENRICEGTDCLNVAFSSGITRPQVMVDCKKYAVGEQWSSDVAVSCILAKHSDKQNENTSLEMLWFTPLTWISIDMADSYLHPVLSLTSLVHCVRLSIIHIQGFITPNFLPICVSIMLALAIFQAWI
jgi:hypothetical protein